MKITRISTILALTAALALVNAKAIDQNANHMQKSSNLADQAPPVASNSRFEMLPGVFGMVRRFVDSALGRKDDKKIAPLVKDPQEDLEAQVPLRADEAMDPAAPALLEEEAPVEPKAKVPSKDDESIIPAEPMVVVIDATEEEEVRPAKAKPEPKADEAAEPADLPTVVKEDGADKPKLQEEEAVVPAEPAVAIQEEEAAAAAEKKGTVIVSDAPAAAVEGEEGERADKAQDVKKAKAAESKAAESKDSEELAPVAPAEEESASKAKAKQDPEEVRVLEPEEVQVLEPESQDIIAPLENAVPARLVKPIEAVPGRLIGTDALKKSEGPREEVDLAAAQRNAKAAMPVVGSSSPLNSLTKDSAAQESELIKALEKEAEDDKKKKVDSENSKKAQSDDDDDDDDEGSDDEDSGDEYDDEDYDDDADEDSDNDDQVNGLVDQAIEPEERIVLTKKSVHSPTQGDQIASLEEAKIEEALLAVISKGDLEMEAVDGKKLGANDQSAFAAADLSQPQQETELQPPEPLNDDAEFDAPQGMDEIDFETSEPMNAVDPAASEQNLAAAARPPPKVSVAQKIYEQGEIPLEAFGAVQEEDQDEAQLESNVVGEDADQNAVQLEVPQELSIADLRELNAPVPALTPMSDAEAMHEAPQEAPAALREEALQTLEKAEVNLEEAKLEEPNQVEEPLLEKRDKHHHHHHASHHKSKHSHKKDKKEKKDKKDKKKDDK